MPSIHTPVRVSSAERVAQFLLKLAGGQFLGKPSPHLSTGLGAHASIQSPPLQDGERFLAP